MTGGRTTILWFRKALRLHDNAALLEAASGADRLVPLYVLERTEESAYSAPRMKFLLETLRDLDDQLSARYASRLIVVRGEDPGAVVSSLIRGDAVGGLPGQLGARVVWEEDPADPKWVACDVAVVRAAKACGGKAVPVGGNTLWDISSSLRAANHKPPTTMPAMVKLAAKLGKVAAPLEAPKSLPPLPAGLVDLFKPPVSLRAVGGYDHDDGAVVCADGVRGGERPALERLAQVMAKKEYIRKFEKPKTSSTAFEPVATTLLSPYVALGALSIRTFHRDLARVYATRPHAEPPTSLLGQLYFREMAYMLATHVGPSFATQPSSVCAAIPWKVDDEALVRAWADGQTGYPYIDAIMRELALTGWIHHLARHAVSCFLTRGDLWCDWRRGLRVFDRYLLDADFALNNFNWLGLAGVAPWSPPYFRVYSPVPNPKSSSLNVDDDGAFIRHFVPELKGMPAKYIYAPWTAPLAVQKQAKCVVGRDYPRPIVDHKAASKKNIDAFKEALAATRATKPPPAKKAKTTAKDEEDE